MCTVAMITPAPRGSRRGNRITALRWAGILRRLGHRVFLEQQYSGRPCDVMVALHARLSHQSIKRFRAGCPAAPLVVALTGTDLYADLEEHEEARRSLEMASLLVVLNADGATALPPHLRERVRVVYQSARAPAEVVPCTDGAFAVCVLGHLRDVKDPFVTARSLRHVPADSRLSVLHIGAALTAKMREEAEAWAVSEPRYRWLGGMSRGKALGILAGCRLLVLTSRLEGGANVISEAIVSSVPVLSTRVSGSIGLLGAEYPGLFPSGDEQALAGLLVRAETDAAFYEELASCCRELRPLFDPARELETWSCVLTELFE